MNKKFLSIFALVALLVAAMAGAAFAGVPGDIKNLTVYTVRSSSNIGELDDSAIAGSQTAKANAYFYSGAASPQLDFELKIDFDAAAATPGFVRYDNSGLASTNGTITLANADVSDTALEAIVKFTIVGWDPNEDIVLDKLAVYKADNTLISTNPVTLTITPVSLDVTFVDTAAAEIDDTLYFYSSSPILPADLTPGGATDATAPITLWNRNTGGGKFTPVATYTGLAILPFNATSGTLNGEASSNEFLKCEYDTTAGAALKFTVGVRGPAFAAALDPISLRANSITFPDSNTAVVTVAGITTNTTVTPTPLKIEVREPAVTLDPTDDIEFRNGLANEPKDLFVSIPYPLLGINTVPVIYPINADGTLGTAFTDGAADTTTGLKFTRDADNGTGWPLKIEFDKAAATLTLPHVVNFLARATDSINNINYDSVPVKITIIADPNPNLGLNFTPAAPVGYLGKSLDLPVTVAPISSDVGTLTKKLDVKVNTVKSDGNMTTGFLNSFTVAQADEGSFTLTCDELLVEGKVVFDVVGGNTLYPVVSGEFTLFVEKEHVDDELNEVAKVGFDGIKAEAAVNAKATYTAKNGTAVTIDATTISADAAEDAGLIIAVDTTNANVLSITGSADEAGSYVIEFEVNIAGNTNNPIAQVLTLVVAAKDVDPVYEYDLSLNSARLPQGEINVPYVPHFVNAEVFKSPDNAPVVGFTDLVVDEDTLPPGIEVLVGDYTVTPVAITFSGTPTALGDYIIDVTATIDGKDYTKELTLTVIDPTQPVPPAFAIDQTEADFYIGQTIPTVGYSVTGTIESFDYEPKNKLVVKLDETAKLFTFEPATPGAKIEAGEVEYTFTVEVTSDGTTTPFSPKFTLTAMSPSISLNNDEVVGVVGNSVNEVIQITLNPTSISAGDFSLTQVGTAIEGLSVDIVGSTVVIRGTPTTDGKVGYVVSSSNSDVLTGAFNIEIAKAPTVNITNILVTDSDSENERNYLIPDEANYVELELQDWTPTCTMLKVSIIEPDSNELSVTPTAITPAARAAGTTNYGAFYTQATGDVLVWLTPVAGTYTFDVYYYDANGDLVIERASLGNYHHSSSSGCDAGFGAFALLGLAGLALLRKKD